MIINNVNMQNNLIKAVSFKGKHYTDTLKTAKKEQKDEFVLYQKEYNMTSEEAQNGIINIVLSLVDNVVKTLTPKENDKIFKEGKKLLKKGEKFNYRKHTLITDRNKMQGRLVFDKPDSKTGIPDRVSIIYSNNPSVAYRKWDFSDKTVGKDGKIYAGLRYTEKQNEKTIEMKYTPSGYCYYYAEKEFGGKRQDVITGSYATINPKEGYDFTRYLIENKSGEICKKPLIQAYIRANKNDSRYIEYNDNNSATAYRHVGNMWVKI